MKTDKRRHKFNWDFILTTLPFIICTGCCIILLFPWDAIKQKQSFIEIVFNADFLLVAVILSYAVMLVKNNYDVSCKICNKLDALSEKYAISADDILKKRADVLEPFSTVFATAKSVKFSGGHLNSVVTDNDDLYQFLRNSAHEVKFIFPNPMNDYVISDFVNNVVARETEQTYRTSILLSLKKIDQIINNSSYSGKIEYRLCEFAPSFGLQLIETENGDNDRLYMELYTIQTSSDNRIQCKLGKTESPENYNRFQEQFELLWGKSKPKEEIAGLQEALQKL